MECFTKKVNSFQWLNIFAKRSIFHIWHGSEYISDMQIAMSCGSCICKYLSACLQVCQINLCMSRKLQSIRAFLIDYVVFIAMDLGNVAE